MPWTSSILFWMLKLIKLVSTRTRYGGPRSVLCDRKSEDETCDWASRRFSSACFSFSAFLAAFSMFSFL